MRTRFSAGLAALLVALSLVVAGCGSDKKSPARLGNSGSASAQDSLLSQPNLTKAIAAIAKDLGGTVHVSLFKIEPLAVTATVVRGGKFKVLVVDKNGAIQTSSAPLTAHSSFNLTSLDPAVPDKLIAQLSEKYKKNLEDVDAMVVVADPFTKKPFWDIYVKGGVDGPYQADLDGSNLGTTAERAAQAAKHPQTQTPGTSIPVPAPVPGGAGATTPDVSAIQRCVAKNAANLKKAQECVNKLVKK